MIKRNTVLLLLLFLGSFASAQTPQMSYIKPEGSALPNASKWTGGGNLYNVDLFTGTASASIPVYDYSIDGLDLGVSLQNSMQGIRVDEFPSCVGAGWDLSYGGSITRQANELEDEVTLYGSPFSGGCPSYYGYWVHALNGFGCSGDKSDVRPDDFTASFGGRTIKFKLYNLKGNQNSITRVPKSNIWVDVYLHNQFNVVSKVTGYVLPSTNDTGFLGTGLGQIENGLFISFEIPDEYGNTFSFERGDYTVKSYKIPLYNKPDSFFTGTYYPTSKWVLTKVKTYSGAEITYEYNYVDLAYTVN